MTHEPTLQERNTWGARLVAAFLLWLGLYSPAAQALEVLGAPDPQPLLVSQQAEALKPVAAALGRLAFWDARGGKRLESVVTATRLGPDTLLTTAHVFYTPEGEDSRLRQPCRALEETREFRWITCTDLRFIPAFALSSEDSGQRPVSHCVQFAAFPGADGLAQEAVCRLALPGAESGQAALGLGEPDDDGDALVPFMAQRRVNDGSGSLDPRWDAVVGDACRLQRDQSILRPGAFSGPSGHALRHYCAIWSGGSGAPVLQADPRAAAGFRIVGIHLGERFRPADIVKTLGARKFLLPSRFKGRNANVAVTVERVDALLAVLGEPLEEPTSGAAE